MLDLSGFKLNEDEDVNPELVLVVKDKVQNFEHSKDSLIFVQVCSCCMSPRKSLECQPTWHHQSNSHTDC